MNHKTNSTLSVLISLIIVVTIVLLFVPYYSEAGENVSLAGYTWFPTDHQKLTTEIAASVEGHSVGDILTATILIPLCGIACIALLTYFDYSIITSIITGVWSLWAAISYTTNAALKLGSLLIAFTVLYIAVCALSIIISYVRYNINKAGDEQEEEYASDYKNKTVTTN